MFQGRNEAGVQGVHPRHFVDEDDFFLLVGGLDEVFEHVEGVEPVFGEFRLGHARVAERRFPCGQLPFHVGVRQTCVLESEFIAESFLDKEGFAYATTAINRHKLRIVRLIRPNHLFLFFGSSDNHLAWI